MLFSTFNQSVQVSKRFQRYGGHRCLAGTYDEAMNTLQIGDVSLAFISIGHWYSRYP